MGCFNLDAVLQGSRNRHGTSCLLKVCLSLPLSTCWEARAEPEYPKQGTDEPALPLPSDGAHQSICYQLLVGKNGRDS